VLDGLVKNKQPRVAMILGPNSERLKSQGYKIGGHGKACLVLSLSLRFNGHFPGEPGLASVY